MKRLLFAILFLLLPLVAQAQAPVPYDWKTGRSHSHLVFLPNEATTGTEIYHMASPIAVGGETHVIKTAAGQKNALGVCVDSCGTTGNAVILVIGQTYCDFDSATTANNFIQNSPTTPGHCTDVGPTRPTNGKIIGRITKTYGTSGVHEVTLFGLGVQGSIQSADNPSGQCVKDDGSFGPCGGGGTVFRDFYIGSSATGYCAWTNKNASYAECASQATRTHIDLSQFTDARVVTNFNAAAVTADIQIHCSDNTSFSPETLLLQQDNPSANTLIVGIWTTIPAGCKTVGGVYVRVGLINGNGTEDPGLRRISIQVR